MGGKKITAPRKSDIKTPRTVMVLLLSALFILESVVSVIASTGTAGAAFLNIPVGAGPAALGSAYSALATDAYAPTWNPAGLGFVDGLQTAAQHLSYLESMHYEYLSLALPLVEHSALGFSAQYLGTGDVASTDEHGTSQGSYSSHYAAYNLSYGQTLTDKLSLGLTGKWINAEIADVSANAYAADAGSLYKATDRLNLAATVTNIGNRLKFLDDSDSLPLAFHLGAAYQTNFRCLLTVEGVYPQTGLAGFHIGAQWQPLQVISIRAGYRTDTVKENTALAGFSTGIGLNLWGQEFAYAWVPYGDLGDTQYFSLLIKFGAHEDRKNLAQYQTIRTHQQAELPATESLAGPPGRSGGETDVEYRQLMQLLSDTIEQTAKLPIAGGQQP